MTIEKDELQSQITYRLIESLSTSERRYETLVENLQEVVFESDLKGAFKFLNSAWESTFSYSIKESLGHPLYDFVFEDDKKLCLELFNFGKEPGSRNKQNTLRFLHKKGHLLWLVVSVTTDGKDNVSGSLYDITKLRETTVSKDYVDNIIRSMIDILIVVDPDGKIRTINPVTVELLGYKEEELIGKPVTTIFAEEVTPFKSTRMKKLIEEGSIRDYDMTYRAKSGEKVPVSFSSSVMKGKDGNIICIVCTARDITERKKAEEALTESEERYRTLVQNVPIGVYRTTPGAKGKFLIANPAFLKMFGFDSEEELKKIALADVCVNPEQRKVFSDNFLAKGSASGQELPLRRKDGTVFWGSVTARVVYDKNRKNPYFDCTIMDITERRKAEEEQRRLIKDLEETNKIMVGRELRMIELKEEVNKLSKELGRPEPYDVLLEKSQKSK